MDRYRRWCFTYFPDPVATPGVYIRPGAALAASENVTYVLTGWELCTNTQRRHQQGYVELATATRLSVVKTYFPSGTHFEACKGTQAQNLVYCKKDGDWQEAGVLKAQGKSKEADELLTRVRAGANMRDLLPDMSGHAYFQYGPGIQRAIDFLAPYRSDFACLKFCWGATGTGKTRAAADAGATFVELRGEFVLGYSEYPRVVCFDEFEPTSCQRKFFLRLTDRYPLPLNVKNGERKFAPTTIYFTGLSDPREWCFKCGGVWDEQCERRVRESGGEVKCFT